MIIYKITNLINDKIYIGQTKQTNDKYYGSGLLIKEAIKKHKKKNFKKEIIVEGDFNQDLTNELEKHYIRLYNSNDLSIGYNLTSGGQCKNEKAEISRQKIKEKFTQLKQDKEHLNKISEAQKKIYRGKTKEEIVEICKNKNNWILSLSEEERKELGRKAGNATKDKNSVKIEVYDTYTKEYLILPSLEECKKYFNTKANSYIDKCVRENKLFRDRYVLKKIKSYYQQNKITK